jgi:alpha-L-fucosidase
MNTFTNQEWGFGDESPELFNPTELDCRQWAKVVKDAGMKGIILTAKHHDGFCLWPSEYTEHSVKNSPWKNGQGDVIKELAEACKEYGLKMGIYYSPWDRNHADYGKPEYINYMRNQLRELLTNYGEVFEVWFDGANGGTGYYGGANEERWVDKRTYYDMQNTYPIIRELQPDAVIFSDAGPDVRWVGNEDGWAFETMWSNLLRDSVYAGMPEYSQLYASGQEYGTHWVPGETNVSIRPGWYYHEYEDHKVRSQAELITMYFNSIGRNTTWLLNFPVDKRGLIHENDVSQLQKVTELIKDQFPDNLTIGAKAEASNVRGTGYEADRAIDGDKNTYWATKDEVNEASLTIQFEDPQMINRILVQEHIALGQRIKSFSIDVETDIGWKQMTAATTIGYKRILDFPEIQVNAIRLNIESSRACPLIQNVEVYHAPGIVVPPEIKRTKSGEITMSTLDDGVDIYFTTDGREPYSTSTKYDAPFLQHEPLSIKAKAIAGDRESETVQIDFDISKNKWKVLNSEETSINTIDGDPETWWAGKGSNEIIVDLGEDTMLKGFTYLPMQGRWITGFISEYEFYTSRDGDNWTLGSSGEFSNILNSPILQRVEFEEVAARFIKLKGKRTVDNNPPSYGEIGVITQ